MNQNQSPMINLNDLKIMSNIIEIATQRGTFKANELATVGTVYEKINNFLTAAQEQQNQESQAQTELPLEEDSTKEDQ